MSQDIIRYDLLTQDALREVIKKVLRNAARDGLPGNHHFYVTFDTNAPGVKMSHRLYEGFPFEMTIILQHQFWDLHVEDTWFSVGLSFKGMSEKLDVPFTAVKEFFDPSVGFALKFEEHQEQEAEKPKLQEVKSAKSSAKPIKLPVKKQEPDDEPPPVPSGGAEIVSLDKFRKKK